MIPGRWIVYRPSDFLWVGICENYIQAFSTWLHLPDRDNWLIGPEEEHQLAIKGRGRWVKFGEPRPLRKGKYQRYRGTPDEALLKKRKYDRDRMRRIYSERKA